MAVGTIQAGATIQASDIRLGRLLQEFGLINDYQLFDALQTQAANGGRLGPILVRRGCLSDGQLSQALLSRHEQAASESGVYFTLAPVPVDRVSLPGAVAICLSLTIPEGVRWSGDPSAACFAAMGMVLPAEATDWIVTARGRHASDRFELLSNDQVALGYDLAIRPAGCADLFPLIAGGASALHVDGTKLNGGPVQAVVEACISHDSLNKLPAGQYVEYVDLAITHPDSDFLG